MARKSVANLKPQTQDAATQSAIEDFQMISQMKDEMATDAIEHQDDETQKAIETIWKTLIQNATGYINVQLSPPAGDVVPVKIDNKYLTMNLRWMAVEIVKNLAILGIQVAEYEFPPSICTNCAAEIIPEKRSKRKAGR